MNKKRASHKPAKRGEASVSSPSRITKKQRAHRGGLRAELAALLYLLGKGYVPVKRRYKTPVGEIDLIVRNGNTLVFVEVKARSSIYAAAEAIHRTNQQRVVRAAQYFLQAHPRYANLQVRFDAVLIAWYSWPQHLTNAFH